MLIKTKSLNHLIRQKPNASLLLFIATISAVVIANSPLAESYAQLLDYPIDTRFNDFLFFPHHGEPMSLIAFVNDALMAIFFFVVGMEIKQEMLVGELSSVRKALLPVIAACGGMIVPVLVYLAVCHEGPAAHGAAIPMATDIAFFAHHLGHDAVDHFVVPAHDLGILRQVRLIPLRRQLRRQQQPIRNASQGRDDHNHILFRRFHNAFHVSQPLHRPYRGPSELQYFHLILIFLSNAVI